MIERLKNKWNSAYSQSLAFTVLAIITLFKNDTVEVSLLLFGVSMILIELGFIENQNKKLIEHNEGDKKIKNETLNLLKKSVNESPSISDFLKKVFNEEVSENKVDGANASNV